MKLPHLFKPKWQHRKADVRLAALADIRDPEALYHVATHSRDDRLCLEAAHRLNDPTLLIRLARNATDAEVRFEAALLVRDQATLSAFALDAWNPEQGKLAVIHIDNAMLLKRLARSARQEAIRLDAALKLEDKDLLTQLALSADDIKICWRIAQHLDDPCLLARVASAKKSNSRLDKLSSKAYRAFVKHLDHCERNVNIDGLSTIIKSVQHTPFKVDAFVRLPPDKLSPELLHHLSQQNHHAVSHDAIRRMLHVIQEADWQVHRSTSLVVCRQCNGDGQFTLRSMAVESSHMAHDLSTCTQCDGLGQQLIHTVTCRHHHHSEVTFHFYTNPRTQPQLKPAPKNQIATKPS